MSTELGHLQVGGRLVAYRLRSGRPPTLLFLPGYASDMNGQKAVALDSFAERSGHAMLRMDYSGTGSSGGRFEDGTLARWLEEVLACLDQLTFGPLILVGSSMGGWIALHAALERAERVQALVGIAAAPDFTQWGFSAEEKAAVRAQGRLEKANPYGPGPTLFTRDLLDSGEQLLLLDGEIGIDCPVRLLHGECDEEVPVELALRTMRALRSADVQLNVIKGGTHRLSEPREIEAIIRTVAAFLEHAP